jgi:hypothetical protein
MVPLRFEKISTRWRCGDWRRRCETRTRCGGFWRSPRSMMAARAAMGRGSAGSGCRRSATAIQWRRERKMPNACIASARAWCRRVCASRTVLKRYYSPRAFGKGRLFVRGSAICLSCAPVMDARCCAIFGPNWTACVGGSS